MRKRSVGSFVPEGQRGALALTPETLEGAYEFLRATAPFRRMNLPHADNIVFKVMVARDRFGHFRGRFKSMPDLNEIGVSQNVVHSTEILMATMAHEMIHLHQHEKGTASRAVHNAEFRRIASRVCRIHGFDLATF
jgi:hypothetical protein